MQRIFEVVKQTLDKLPPDERENVERIADNFAIALKMNQQRRSPGCKPVAFGRQSALELVAQIGIYLNELEERKKDG